MGPTRDNEDSKFSPSIPPGGDITALDMNSSQDRRLVARATKKWPKRWRGVTDEVKDQVVKDLSSAADTARALLLNTEAALPAAKVLSEIARTVVAMESQVQADDHLEDKYDRLDAGRPTDSVQFIAGVNQDNV